MPALQSSAVGLATQLPEALAAQPSAQVERSPSAVRGRGHRPRDTAHLSVQRLSRHADVAALESEWRELYELAAGRNPYASPDWVIAWLEHLVHENELAVLTVRRDGRLIGVAPCYLRSVARVLGASAARTVQLAGTIRFPGLTELPQALAARGETRSVLRAVVGHWIAAPERWDWLELPLDAEQGWFEPQWLGEGEAFTGLVQHKTTRAAVVLPLDGAAASVRTALKRNVWESVKRARNRLDKSGRVWRVVVHRAPDEVAAALPVLRRLHGARASIAGRRVHPDVLGDPARYAFVADAAGRMAANDRVELLTLDVDGTAIAALLVLRAPRAAFLALSGVDPHWWHVGPVTLLQYAAIERAAERGDAEVNLSVGPDISKLRWSDRVVQHPEFVVCGPRPGSRRRLAAYAAAGAVAAVRREAGRHQVRRTGTEADAHDRD
ncbi:MAG TPA: GNAT family N-acetyltransferase [Actinocrinis sp.]|jgi:CelD/BcsL family acetyltransferase involved in cellulose biosynthesis|uniref:GNAT family N-acetyltransferase n=1 Tax=Actinocrinis sp. TaxID=1920516 RepID=UPI002DDCDCB8|nr:GNAT family N-acetyltransferase [Actinocrinis sp.]HEV3170530.1 GNAT family N-acetyltransferase [Actinocrinis sp.]